MPPTSHSVPDKVLRDLGRSFPTRKLKFALGAATAEKMLG